MKATLEFMLPEEREEHLQALKGGYYAALVFEARQRIQRLLRGKIDIELSPELADYLNDIRVLLSEEE